MSTARGERARRPLSAILGDGCLVPGCLHNTPPSGGFGEVWGCLVGSLRQRCQGCGLALVGRDDAVCLAIQHDMLANPCLTCDWCQQRSQHLICADDWENTGIKVACVAFCDTSTVCLSILVRRAIGA